MTDNHKCPNCSRPTTECPTCGNARFCPYCSWCDVCENRAAKRLAESAEGKRAEAPGDRELEPLLINLADEILSLAERDKDLAIGMTVWGFGREHLLDADARARLYLLVRIDWPRPVGLFPDEIEQLVAGVIGQSIPSPADCRRLAELAFSVGALTALDGELEGSDLDPPPSGP